MPKPWNVCDTIRDEYTSCWGNMIAVYMMLYCVLILEVIVLLGITPSELMQCLRPPLELVQDEVQQLLIV